MYHNYTASRTIVYPVPPPEQQLREATEQSPPYHSLPNIMVTNHRSIFPKFNSLVDEILENEMHLGLHSDIWEDKENITHANLIEEAF